MVSDIVGVRISVIPSRNHHRFMRWGLDSENEIRSSWWYLENLTSDWRLCLPFLVSDVIWVRISVIPVRNHHRFMRWGLDSENEIRSSWMISREPCIRLTTLSAISSVWRYLSENQRDSSQKPSSVHEMRIGPREWSLQFVVISREPDIRLTTLSAIYGIWHRWSKNQRDSIQKPSSVHEMRIGLREWNSQFVVISREPDIRLTTLSAISSVWRYLSENQRDSSQKPSSVHEMRIGLREWSLQFVGVSREPDIRLTTLSAISSVWRHWSENQRDSSQKPSSVHEMRIGLREWSSQFVVISREPDIRLTTLSAIYGVWHCWSENQRDSIEKPSSVHEMRIGLREWNSQFVVISREPDIRLTTCLPFLVSDVIWVRISVIPVRNHHRFMRWELDQENEVCSSWWYLRTWHQIDDFVCNLWYLTSLE